MRRLFTMAGSIIQRVELRHLKAPLWVIFATHNMWINREMVSLFELGMLRAANVRSATGIMPAMPSWFDPEQIRRRRRSLLKRTLAFSYARNSAQPESALLARAILSSIARLASPDFRKRSI